jgi:L-alanine-DL-glutamate epimerase-like enolase superfamily enzyme
MATFDRIADLPLSIEGYELERLEQAVSSDFTRVTTVIHLRGGEEGVGEDVTYNATDQDVQLQRGPVLPLAGDWTLRSFSAALEGIDLWPSPPQMEAQRDYRRWAYESAGLDLALRQAGTSLAQALEREPRPVTYVVSMRLGTPPSLDRLRGWAELYPGLKAKLDARSDWDQSLVDELNAMGVIDSVDLKGRYEGTVVDNPPDPRLYRLVAEGFPHAWIEDPALTPETEPVLEPHRDRVTWDAIIHSVADIEALPWAPRMLNVKPSRFGTLERLFDTFDYCAERGIETYGGGQFELGPGRGHIQYLASLFSPDNPNDVAPSGFNFGEPRAGLPPSPLEAAVAPAGFRWNA